LECGGLTPLWLTLARPVAVSGLRQSLTRSIACSSRLAPRVRQSQVVAVMQMNTLTSTVSKDRFDTFEARVKMMGRTAMTDDK